MSDPYRPAYYPPPTAGSPYNQQEYADSNDQYGPLTTHHRPSHSGASSGYYPQSQTQLTHSSRRDSRDDDYLSPDHSSHRHKSKSGHSRHHSSDDSSDEHDSDRGSHSRHERSNSHSRIKEVGATAVGGAAGALVGHKIGHGNIGTLAGLAVGALGARALEQQYEKREERKRLEEPFEGRRRDGGGGGSSRPGTRERRKSFVEQAQDKVSGFLGVGDGGKDQRRSRSHVGTSSAGGRDRERDRDRRYDDSDSEDGDYDRYERRGGKGDRYGGGSSSAGRSRRDDY